MSQATIDEIAVMIRSGLSVGRVADLLGLDVWKVAAVATETIYRRRH